MGCGGDSQSMLFNDCGCGCKGKKQEKKFMISLMSALVFFLVAHPQTFLLVRKLVGEWVSSASGCPSKRGLLLHSLVFLLVTWGMMNFRVPAMFKKEGMENETTDAKTLDSMLDGMPGAGPSVTPAIEEDTMRREQEKEKKIGEVAETGVAPLDSPDQPLEGTPPAPEPEEDDSGLFAPFSSSDEPPAPSVSSSMMGAPSMPDESSASPLKAGAYQQCRCSDGSSVMLFK